MVALMDIISMSDWKKLQLTDHHAELKSLRLSGTTTGSMEANPDYDPNNSTSQNLHLYDFTGDDNAWKTNEDNLNASETPWISELRSVTGQNTPTTHKPFHIPGLRPVCMDMTLIPNNGSAAMNDGTVQPLTGGHWIYMSPIDVYGVDHSTFFVELEAQPSSPTLTYSMTDGTSTAIYEIDDVDIIPIGSGNVIIESTLGGHVSGSYFSDLDTGPVTICFPDFTASLTTGTGPDSGILPSTDPDVYNIALATGERYLYAETTDLDNYTYSITSPLINVTDYATKKLVFFFHLHGANSGHFEVHTSPSSESLYVSTQMAMQYSNWPGISGAMPQQPDTDDHWSGGDSNPNVGALLIGPGQIQASGSSPFNRVEVDLATFTSGYIWIVYESGDPSSPLYDQDSSDFAISNLYLNLGGYTQPETIPVVAPTPTLKISQASGYTNIRFLNLPESNPGIPGALYKREDPVVGFGEQSLIMISTGSA
jgi:hypothetical protein